MKKKKLTALALAGVLGIASLGMMGCGKESTTEELKPYIEVAGLDTAYIQNEEINLDGAKILYYSDQNDATADEVRLQESMIANFSTEEVGEKKMKVFFNGCELEIDYSVVSKEFVQNLYATALDNMKNSDYVRVVEELIDTNAWEELDVEATRLIYNLTKEKIYFVWEYQDEITAEEWIENDGSKWMDYYRWNDNYSRTDVNDEVLEYNNLIGWYIENGPMPIIPQEMLSQVTLSYDIEGEYEVLSATIEMEDEEDGVYIYQFEYQILDGKIVSYSSMCSLGDLFALNEATISYNEEDIELVNLPDNADEWELEE